MIIQASFSTPDWWVDSCEWQGPPWHEHCGQWPVPGPVPCPAPGHYTGDHVSGPCRHWCQVTQGGTVPVCSSLGMLTHFQLPDNLYYQFQTWTLSNFLNGKSSHVDIRIGSTAMECTWVGGHQSYGGTSGLGVKTNISVCNVCKGLASIFN